MENKYIDQAIEILNIKLKKLINDINRFKELNESLEEFIANSKESELFTYYDGWGQETATQEECKIWIKKNVVEISKWEDDVEEIKIALETLEGRCLDGESKN